MSKRNEFIKQAIEFASDLAEYYDCPDMVSGEDRQKGVWGEGFTAWLEGKVGGDCSTEIKWSGGDVKVIDKGKRWECERPERQVEFRFRFSSPCVSLALDHCETFAEIEFSDWDNDLRHTGEFRLHECHSWGDDGGYGLLTHLVTAWNVALSQQGQI